MSKERDEAVVYGKKVYVSFPEGIVDPDRAEYLVQFVDTSLERIDVMDKSLSGITSPVGITLSPNKEVPEGNIYTGINLGEKRVVLSSQENVLAHNMNNGPGVNISILQNTAAGVATIALCELHVRKTGKILSDDQVHELFSELIELVGSELAKQADKHDVQIETLTGRGVWNVKDFEPKT